MNSFKYDNCSNCILAWKLIVKHTIIFEQERINDMNACCNNEKNMCLKIIGCLVGYLVLTIL